MKLLYISGTYCPADGGAEISAHTLIKHAQSKGIDVLAATDIENTAKYESGLYDGIPLIGINHHSREIEIKNTIEEHQPDCIMTQLMWSNVVMKVAKEVNVPSVLRFCKTPAYIDISDSSVYRPESVLVVSDFVGNYVKSNWDRDSYVVEPLIDLQRCMSVDRSAAQYITMFNPNTRKGGDIFREVAKQMPDHNFAVVGGWQFLKTDNDKGLEKIRRLCESIGIEYKGQKLRDIKFDDLKNVTILPTTPKVSNIYDLTKTLCIPSQWEENFGRVSIEGMSNGIPTLGSDVGGLSKIVTNGGVVIHDYSNPEAWVNALLDLDSESRYEELAAKAKNYVDQHYDYDNICKNFIKVLETTAEKGKS